MRQRSRKPQPPTPSLRRKLSATILLQVLCCVLPGTRFLKGFPIAKTYSRGPPYRSKVDVAALRAAEEKRFDALISAADWDGLLTRYPLRESSAFDHAVAGLKIKDQATYQGAVLKLLQDDSAAVSDLSNLLGDLYASVTA